MTTASSPTVRVGNVSIIAVQDLAVRGAPSYMFPQLPVEAFEPWKHYQNERGNFPMNIGTFVLRSGGRTMLVDTGIGNKPRQGYQPGNLLENLAIAGISPDQVDLVVCTHMHIDHVGWNTVRQGDSFVPAFPRARYLFVQDEWDAWTGNPDLRSRDYIQDSCLPLEHTGRLELVDKTATIAEGVTYVPAPGHSPAHACLAISSGGEKAMIIGDLAHHPIQLTETSWNVAMDMNPTLAQQSREAILARAEQEGGLVIGGHFPPPGYGRLVRIEDRRLWQAL